MRVAVAGIVLALVSSFAARADDAPQTLPSEPRRVEHLDLLDQLLVRERLLERDVERARRALEQGNVAEGVAVLQAILDGTKDAFQVDLATQSVSSARAEVLRLIGALDRESLRLYEQQVRFDAEDLLRRAEESRDPALFAEVTRRYYFTDAGYAAADWLATRWLDQGFPARAARLWGRLLSDPVHRGRLTPIVRAKAAVALRASGTFPDAAGTEGPRGAVAVLIGGEPATQAQAPTFFPAPEPAPPWRLFLGSEDRNRSVPASAPYLRALWSAPLAEDSDRAFHVALTEWEQSRGALLQPRAVAASPLILDDCLVVRDATGVRGMDRVTGQTRWHYATRTAYSHWLELGDEEAGVAARVQRAFAGNASLGTLSSDGTRIFAIDFPEPPQAVEAGAPRPIERGNCLVALSIPQDAGASPQPLWVFGNDPNGDEPGPHVLLGPPLPLDGRLYAIAERDRQLNLLVLDSDTGELLWSQGLVYLDQPVDRDLDRLTLAASPSFADGILVCPAPGGVLIGVDVTLGTLEWSHYCGVDRVPRPGLRWHGHVPPQADGPFPNLPHIHRQRVVYLPADSDAIHCVDLLTGQSHWRTERLDAEYIGAVTDETVVVVGSRNCRGLSLADGSEQWVTRLGMPSGRGIHAGDRYLVPLQEGRVAALEIPTGEEVGMTRLLSPRHFGAPDEGVSTDWKQVPGNLVAAGGMVYSLSPRGVCAYPQLTTLLTEVRQRLATSPTRADLVVATELELSLGESRAARGHLEAALAMAGDESADERAEHLLRELLYVDLDQDPARQEEILARLDQLAQTPEERARFLIRTGELRLAGGDFERALAVARELWRLDIEVPLAIEGEPEWRVSTKSWAGALTGRVLERTTAAERGAVEAIVTADQLAVMRSGQRTDLEGFLALYPDWPQAEAVRVQLARQAAERGQSQYAELLLLANRRSADVRVVAESMRELAELWDRRGLFDEAAAMLVDLGTEYADVPLSDGSTGREFAETYRADALTRASHAALAAAPVPPQRVQISSRTRSAADLSNFLARETLRHSYGTPFNSSMHLVEVGAQPAGRVVAVDKRTGVAAGHVQVPLLGGFLPLLGGFLSETRSSQVGHLLPAGSVRQAFGISLLELDAGQPLWEFAPSELELRPEVLRVGPAGPTFCAFQAKQYLVVLDPATGRPLWQRTDIDPDAGLLTDSSGGLFGDDEALVLFAGDRSRYTVFRTATGEVLRRGTLEADARFERRAYGRKLFFVAKTPEGPRARIWDPLDDRLLLDDGIGTHLISYETIDRELVVVTSSGDGRDAAWDRLRILEPESETVCLDLPLDEELGRNLSYVRAFRDQERYYVNLYRPAHVAQLRGMPTSYWVSEQLLTTTHVQGDLIAVDRASGEIVWRRLLSQRSFVHVPHARLPFLIGLSRLGDHWHRGPYSRSMLVVETIDARTGETIGRHDGFTYDRIVRVSSNPEEKSVELHRQRSVIRLDYGQPAQRIPLGDFPL